MIPAILALFVLALAWVGWLGAGVFLMWRGVRGRLVDRDPRCGRCDYILLGFLSRPSHCPECGSRLLRPGAVRLGRREPRRSFIMAGTLMMLLGLSPAVVALSSRSAVTAGVAAPPALPSVALGVSSGVSQVPPPAAPAPQDRGINLGSAAIAKAPQESPLDSSRRSADQLDELLWKPLDPDADSLPSAVAEVPPPTCAPPAKVVALEKLPLPGLPKAQKLRSEPVFKPSDDSIDRTRSILPRGAQRSIRGHSPRDRLVRADMDSLRIRPAEVRGTLITDQLRSFAQRNSQSAPTSSHCSSRRNVAFEDQPRRRADCISSLVGLERDRSEVIAVSSSFRDESSRETKSLRRTPENTAGWGWRTSPSAPARTGGGGPRGRGAYFGDK